MSISSQLPPIPLAMAGASLRALAQAAGQTVEARVLSQAGNGATQVQIGRQVLTLSLPQSQPVGATLTLAVQQTEGHLQLTLEGVRPPPGGPVSISGAAQNAPATQVQLSAIALSGGQIDLAPATRPSLPGRVPAAGRNGSTQAAPGPTQAYPPAMAPLAPYGAGAIPQTSPATSAPVTPAVVNAASAPAPTAAPPLGATASPQTVTVASSSVPVGAANGSATQVVTANSTSPVTGNVGQEAAAAGVRVSGQPAAPPPSTMTAARLATPSTVPPAAPLALVASHVPRAEIPYAVAAPVSAPARPVVGVAGSASTGLPPVGQAVSSSIVGQHAPPPNMAGVPAAQANQVRPVPVQPQSPVPANPQAALAQMVQQALPRQDSVVGLTTVLSAAIGKFALPEPVAKAAQQVLAARVPLDGPQVSGAALKTAVLKSGIFQEALLASGQGAQAAGDAKSALLGLRQSLGAWLGQQSPVTQVAGVAPPLRGLLPRARSADGGTPAIPDDMLEAGRMLLERTEAALSRVRLHQSASLPEQSSAARQHAQWSLDLPVVVGGQQHLLQMQIHKDPEGEDERPEDRGWQIRFAINLSGAGEIGAQISLRAGSAGVLLWAERPETSAALSTDVEALKSDLAALGLKPRAVVIRTGAPPPSTKPAPSASGQHLDATR